MRTIISIAVALAFLMMAGCENSPSPKPRGYFRIDLPQHTYQQFDTTYPFGFEYPVYTEIQTQGANIREPYWFNVHYPDFDGTVYFSYKPIKNNLARLVDDSHEFVGKHMAKASAVDELVIIDDKEDKYGLIFEIEGSETASPYQFYLTDSTRHFLRGALYFNNKPNNDSLAPVINFVQEDMEHLIRTFYWKEL
jgi:gliding motility-associated lipoprotein GldD